RDDPAALAEWAAAGEEVARRAGTQLELGEFLMWQALLSRRSGDEPKARRLARSAAATGGRLKEGPGELVYDPPCALHQGAGQPEKALKARTRELALVAGTGQFDYETRTRVKRCELLARMGLPLGEDLVAAREVAGRLKYPGKYLEQLDRLAGTGDCGAPPA